jgi:hypothetical protein
MNPNEVSTRGKGGASARVADVLKSSIERGLIEEDDAVLLAGHGSHIVTAIVDPSAEESQMAVSWDDNKYRAFAERLTQLRDGAAL